MHNNSVWTRSAGARRVALLVVVVVLVGLLGRRILNGPSHPNVLLITLDTTRADRLGCYGYSRALTPTLDALAASGILFERAYTPAPLTLPAHASLMTGLQPPEHGLVVNARGSLDTGISTLAEVLRDGGYETGAFVGSFVLHAKFGLQRGFDHYDDDMTNTDPTPDGLHRQRDGIWVVDSALRWLKQRRKKPFFCWVHFYDAHTPYSSHPDEFGDRFQNEPYDAGIAHVDRQVQRLVDYLQSGGISERTLVVLVGDHGESLGAHDEIEHGLTLYNAVLHVPWIWSGPGRSAKGKRVSQPVSIVDLRPTLLEMLQLRDPSPGSRRSLSPLLQGGELAAADCYSATDFPLLEHGWSPQRSLTTSDWKYIRSAEVELYDLNSDPEETHNLAATRPDLVRDMEDRLAALEQAMTVRDGAAVDLTPRERRALASLGYLGGHAPQPQVASARGPLPDVKRMLPIYNKVEAARKLLLDGNAPDAERRLLELSRQEPDYLPARLHLADAFTRQKKFVEGRDTALAVLEIDPENAEARFQLGNVELAQERYAEAAEEFRRVLALRPYTVEAQFNLGECLAKLGRFADAEVAIRRALDEDPLFVAGHIRLGHLLFAQRRTLEAEEHYREALRFTPDSGEAHANLALLLAGQKHFVEAGEHFDAAVKHSPANAELQANFGAFLLQQGRLDEALRALEEALRLNPQHPQAKILWQQARSRNRP